METILELIPSCTISSVRYTDGVNILLVECFTLRVNALELSKVERATMHRKLGLYSSRFDRAHIPRIYLRTDINKLNHLLELRGAGSAFFVRTGYIAHVLEDSPLLFQLLERTGGRVVSNFLLSISRPGPSVQVKVPTKQEKPVTAQKGTHQHHFMRL